MCKDNKNKVCTCTVCGCNTEVFIFDLDDTLLECQVNYCKVVAEFIAKIVNHFGRHTPHPSKIAERQSIIDIELIQKYGYQKERFPQGFVETYKEFHFSIYHNENYDNNFIEELLELGNSVYKIIPKEIPYAIELLETLKSQGKKLYILTAGAKEVQEYKIYNTEIHKYFPEDQIFINERKGIEEFEEVLNHIYKKYGHVKKDNIYMIGDSLRNDINTSVQLGLNAIHVDVATWSYNNVKVEHEYEVVKDLLEIQNFLLKKGA